MKKILMFSIVLMLIAASQASAGTVGTVTFSYTSGHYGFPGGEFTLNFIEGDPVLSSFMSNYAPVTKDVGAYTDPSFQTFCLEYQEEVYLGGTYKYSLTDNAMGGGVSDPSGDPISIGTAYLYSTFAAGQLQGYNYTSGAGRAASAAALQNAIWFLEGEGGATNGFTDLVAGMFGGLNGAMADNNGAYGVMVLHLTTPSGGAAQDQLIYVPDGGLTALLLGIGVGGLALFSRKLR